MATCPKCKVSFTDELQTCPTDGEGLLPDEAFAGADQDLQKGDTVGEYVVENKLGEGGFGAVFKATHPLIGKQVAIKVLFRQYSSNPQMVSRFISEARAVNQIRHRNIIDIFSFGQVADGRHYYVMEFLDGDTLDEYIAERGRLPLAEAIPILRSLARALDAAHGKGIAHRDLKPENIFLAVDEDGTIHPKLLDFGIAKLLSTDAPHQHKTRTGAPMGTPYYMSPEQCRGRDVDHRTDTYSFGIVAYQMLTGTLPFDGQDYMEILLKQLSEQPPPPSSIAPELNDGCDQAVAWMMAKDPGKRPPNLVTAVRALEEAAASAGVAVAAPITDSHAKQTAAALMVAATPDWQRRSTKTPTPATAAARALTPANAALGHLDTMAAETPAKAVSFIAAESAEIGVPPVPSKATSKIGLVLAAAAAVIVGGAVVAVLFTRGEGKAKTGPPAAGVTDPAGEPQPPPSKPVADPTDQPAGDQPAARVEPALPAEITIDIQGTPDGTDVLIGGKAVAKAPGALKLPRGDTAVVLEFKKAGYKTKKQEVTPARDLLLAVEMTADRKSGRRDNKDKKDGRDKKDKDSIEDPFR